MHTENRTYKGILIAGEKEYTLTAGESRNLLQVLMEQVSGLSAPCGGAGRCGKCAVLVKKGKFAVSAEDRKHFSEKELEAGYRLACTAVISGDFEAVWLGRQEEDMEVLTETGKEEQKEMDKQAEEADKKDRMTDEKAGESHQVLAIDIGTTTLAFGVYEEGGGELLAHQSGLNHQRAFGGDVIARIQASNEGERERLRELIREDLRKGIENLTKSGRINIENLTNTAIAGNTTMIHLLMGYSCEGLGVVPFTPYSVDTVHSTLEEICGLNSDCPVVVFPGISAFVGGDIVSGMMAVELSKKEKPCLFLDLGTNGEMALGNDKKLLVTSTAAGPAFEGGNISCGIGSIPGAICHVKIEDGVQTETIGDMPPVGICGTGVVETVAELLRAEELDETGLLEEEYFEGGYLLATDPEGKPISFTQKDIREIQLAKAAIRAGLETLLVRFGISYEDVGEVYVAGGFGYKLDLKKAVEIGMLPEELLERTVAVGNTSLQGAAYLALGRFEASDAEMLAGRAEEISLANDKNFQDFYMEYMLFESA